MAAYLTQLYRGAQGIQLVRLKNIWRKFRFLTKISIFDKKFQFYGTFLFLTKISSYMENLDFCRKFGFFVPNLISFTRILIFEQQ